MSQRKIYTSALLDHETGEVTHTKWVTKEVKNTEMFVRTYVNDIGIVAKLTRAEQSVILCCLKFLQYDTNKIYIDSKTRQDIAECGNLKMNTVNTAISRLMKKNFLIKESSSGYLLNPKIFFYGSDLSREKVFDLHIQYKIKDEE